MAVAKRDWQKYRKNRLKEIRSKWYGKIRTRIFTRDNFTCALTGKTKCKLNMHHIYRYVDYPKLRYDFRNLITLSEEAHELITGEEEFYAELLWNIAEKREIQLELEAKKNGEPKDSKPRKRRRNTKTVDTQCKRPRKKRGDRSK